MHESFGDVAELVVAVLADAHEHAERLVGRDLVALHEDALGLSDQLAGHGGARQARLVLRLAYASAACAANSRPTCSDSSSKANA